MTTFHRGALWHGGCGLCPSSLRLGSSLRNPAHLPLSLPPPLSLSTLPLSWHVLTWPSRTPLCHHLCLLRDAYGDASSIYCELHLLQARCTSHYASHCICACLHNRDTSVAESELPNSSCCVVVGLAGTATKTMVHIINMSTMGEPRVRGERRECQCALDRTVLRSRQRSS